MLWLQEHNVAESWKCLLRSASMAPVFPLLEAFLYISLHIHRLHQSLCFSTMMQVKFISGLHPFWVQSFVLHPFFSASAVEVCLSHH